MTTTEKSGMKIVGMVMFALLAMGGAATSAKAQGKEPYQGGIDWAAGNGDAGGSVDCQGQYVANGVAFAIVSGGRSAVINQALFETYKGNFDHAFSLVLMTQCHNPSAQEELMVAGEKAVLTYLVSNYQATGIDPTQVIALTEAAVEALAAM